MIYLLLFILSTSLSGVFIHRLQATMPVNVLLLFSTVFAIAIFHAINYRHTRLMYSILLRNKSTYYMLMICTLAMWGGGFLAASISPTFAEFIQMGIGAALGSLSLMRSAPSLENKISACLINSVILAALLYTFINYNLEEVAFILLFVTVVGFFDFKYAHVSHKINELGLSSSQVIAGRFWLLLVASLAFQGGDLRAEYFAPTHVIMTLALAIATFLLPVYFYQKSIATIGPDLALIGCGLLPLTTYLIEKALTTSITPPGLGVLAALLTLSIILPPLYFKYMSAPDLKQPSQKLASIDLDGN